jgi:hypothetical protein
MRKLLGGLIVGFLAVASPAAAQVAGSQDPLSLITSGMVLPYVGGPGNQSWLEVEAPIRDVDVHMFFYDVACNRSGDSVNVALTANDVEFLRLDNINPGAPSGLIAAAGVSSSGFELEPFSSAVHARVLWVTPTGAIRTLEPIALSTRDNDRAGGTGTWSPLRTGATFFAPRQGGGNNTTIWFVCPNSNIQAAFPAIAGFPQISPVFVTAPFTTALRARIYDDEENFLRDVLTNCNCLTARVVSEISNVYSDAVLAPGGTYTEVEGGNATGAFSFTGYRAMTVGDFNSFGRLSNGCRGDLATGNCIIPAIPTSANGR